jgi:hypothetical protein
MAQNFLPNSRKIFCQKPTHFFDFVVLWQKNLREFGRKLCDFRKTADHNFFQRIPHIPYVASKKQKKTYCKTAKIKKIRLSRGVADAVRALDELCIDNT